MGSVKKLKRYKEHEVQYSEVPELHPIIDIIIKEMKITRHLDLYRNNVTNILLRSFYEKTLAEYLNKKNPGLPKMSPTFECLYGHEFHSKSYIKTAKFMGKRGVLLEYLGYAVLEKHGQKFSKKLHKMVYRWEVVESYSTELLFKEVGKWPEDILNQIKPLDLLKIKYFLHYRFIAPFFSSFKLQEEDFESVVVKTEEGKRESLFGFVNPEIYQYEKNRIDQVNALFPEEEAFLKLRRIFSRDYQKSGRLYNPITNMTKTERKALFTQKGYAEVDLDSAMLNILFIFKTGNIAPFHPVKGLIEYILYKDKQLHKKIDGFGNRIYSDQRLKTIAEQLYPIIKPLIITMFNAKVNKDIMLYKLIEQDLHLDLNTKSKIRSHNSFYKGEDSKSVKKKMINQYREIASEISKAYVSRYPENEEIGFEISGVCLERCVNKKLSAIKSFLYNSNWDWTQYIESETMINLCLKEKLIPYILHDAIYVPEKREKEIEKKLYKELIRNTKIYKKKKIKEEQIQTLMYIYTETSDFSFQYKLSKTKMENCIYNDIDIDFSKVRVDSFLTRCKKESFERELPFFNMNKRILKKYLLSFNNKKVKWMIKAYIYNRSLYSGHLENKPPDKISLIA